MRNILFEGYNLLDAALMKGVNAGVRAYNWTTGETKFELAKNLSITAPVLESIGFFNYALILGAICTSIYLAMSHSDQRLFEDIDKAERNASEMNALSVIAEQRKNIICRVNGTWWPLIGSYLYFTSSRTNGYFIQDRTETDMAILIGNFIRGGSHFIMRADYLPPRKNCVQRGLEKLAELQEAAITKPTVQNVPVALQFSMLSGEIYD